MEKEKYKEINPSQPQGQGNALSLPVSLWLGTEGTAQ